MAGNGKRRAFGDRLQYLAAHLTDYLPHRVKIALSGEPAIVIDGQQLDPQAQFLRAVRRRRMPFGLLEPTIAAGRTRYRRQAEIFAGPATPVGSVRDFEIPGPAGPLRVRHYAPASLKGSHHNSDGGDAHHNSDGGGATLSGSRLPLLVYLHGGGFVIGDLDTHDEPCRILCSEGKTHVLSVDYRLAPEHPFPAALDDGCAAFRWAKANAASVGADPARVAIGGDSAGGNLSAAASMLLRDQGVAPSAQLLIYPATDASVSRPSREMFNGGFVLTTRDYDAFFDAYLGPDRRNGADPRVSPLRASDFSNLPPALLVVSGFDILRDEGEAYARALNSAGTTTRVVRCLDLEHGFIHLTGICGAARRALHSIANEWSALVGDATVLADAPVGS
jgi:acetyl esterase/lipase